MSNLTIVTDRIYSCICLIHYYSLESSSDLTNM